MIDETKITHRDKQYAVEEVHQEEVLSMACSVIDIVKDKLELMGLCDADIETILENDCYDDVMAYFEKMFNYPEYRNYN